MPSADKPSAKIPSKPTSRFRTEQPKADANDPTPDAETEFLETGHIPDRDQVFDVSNFHRPSHQIHEFEQSWSGDDEERMLGSRDDRRDVVDALRDRGHITGPKSGESPIEEMDLHTESYETPIASLSEDDYLADDEVQKRAAALSIPGRENLSRLQLVMAIKAAESAS